MDYSQIQIPTPKDVSLGPIPPTMNKWILKVKLLSAGLFDKKTDETDELRINAQETDQIPIEGSSVTTTVGSPVSPKYPCDYQSFKSIDKFNEEWIVEYDDKDSLLGTGASAVVFKCYKKSFISHICTDYILGTKFCCKIIDLSEIDDVMLKMKIINNSIDEYNLVKNAHLLNYKDLFIDNLNYQCIIIVMEQLQKCLENINACLGWKDYDFKCENYKKGVITLKDENSVRQFVFDLATNIKAIHGLGYAHLDIKPSNIMFNANAQKWCIIDYGLYRKMNKKEVIKRRGILGTKGFVAPEISLKKKSGKSILSPSADIYAFGLVVLSVLNGGPLFAHYKVWGNGKKLSVQNGKSIRFMHSEQGHCELYQFLKYLLLFAVISIDLHHLLRSCLEFEHSKRANIDQVLSMKYFDKTWLELSKSVKECDY